VGSSLRLRQSEVQSPAGQLGFVINVIEDLEERIEALRGAYVLADELLVISAMLANQDAVKGTPYGDGCLHRGTLSKVLHPRELRQFIAEALHEEPFQSGLASSMYSRTRMPSSASCMGAWKADATSSG